MYTINVKAALDITKTMMCNIIHYGNIFLSSYNDSDVHDLKYTKQYHSM